MFAFEELKEKFLNIPEDVQEAISSNEVNERLLALADKYRLQYDEADELTKEIGYIMLGLKPKDNFIKNIQKVTELDSKKAKSLAHEINSTIFKKIRKSLREIHKIPQEDSDENLDEEIVRKELLNEIENPTEKTTDLIKRTKQKILEKTKKPLDRFTIARKDGREATVVSANGNKAVHPSVFERNETAQKETKIDEQKEQKNYIIDPYREPIE